MRGCCIQYRRQYPFSIVGGDLPSLSIHLHMAFRPPHTTLTIIAFYGMWSVVPRLEMVLFRFLSKRKANSTGVRIVTYQDPRAKATTA
ncbi:hypothetical protein V8F33_006043 [Rhypophila sp. PSN 637]